MLSYCQLDLWEQTSEEYKSKYIVQIYGLFKCKAAVTPVR